jgi:hypothetical protein
MSKYKLAALNAHNVPSETVAETIELLNSRRFARSFNNTNRGDKSKQQQKQHLTSFRSRGSDHWIFFHDEDVFVNGVTRSVRRLFITGDSSSSGGAAVGWVINESFADCMVCGGAFGMWKWPHHCRACGNVVCEQCSPEAAVIQELPHLGDVRVCTQCCWGQEVVSATNLHIPLEDGKELQKKRDDREKDDFSAIASMLNSAHSTPARTPTASDAAAAVVSRSTQEKGEGEGEVQETKAIDSDDDGIDDAVVEAGSDAVADGEANANADPEAEGEAVIRQLNRAQQRDGECDPTSPSVLQPNRADTDLATPSARPSNRTHQWDNERADTAQSKRREQKQTLRRAYSDGDVESGDQDADWNADTADSDADGNNAHNVDDNDDSDDDAIDDFTGSRGLTAYEKRRGSQEFTPPTTIVPEPLLVVSTKRLVAIKIPSGKTQKISRRIFVNVCGSASVKDDTFISPEIITKAKESSDGDV